MVKGLKGLEDYNWSEMPKTRTNTEQKMNIWKTKFVTIVVHSPQ